MSLKVNELLSRIFHHSWSKVAQDDIEPKSSTKSYETTDSTTTNVVDMIMRDIFSKGALIYKKRREELSTPISPFSLLLRLRSKKLRTTPTESLIYFLNP